MSCRVVGRTRQILVQYRGGVLQYKRGDFGLLDGVAATRPRRQGVLERVQPQGHPHGNRRRPALRFGVSILIYHHTTSACFFFAVLLCVSEHGAATAFACHMHLQEVV